MLLLDTPAQNRWREGATVEHSAALRQSSLQQEIVSNTVSVEDDAGRDTSKLLAQLGKPLSCAQVVEKLKLCNPRLVFERSLNAPERMGIYKMQWERDVTGGWSERKVFICGMEAGIMPEFSVLHKGTKRVPDPDIVGRAVARDALQWKHVDTFVAETRGWRTVLLRLLHQKLINAADVQRHFDWQPSQSSEKWYNQTKGAINVRSTAS